MSQRLRFSRSHSQARYSPGGGDLLSLTEELWKSRMYDNEPKAALFTLSLANSLLTGRR